MEYVRAIKRDVQWLGYQWDAERYASDYFEQLYDWAVQLIRDGKAYVDDLSEEEIRDYRGTVTEPGRESPYRDRSVEENLDLFERMKNGEFPDGSRVLRAKIDMAHPNMKMRDPLMYRIRHAEHYRRGDAWCLYPMYDWAHGQSDAIEDITHSICTLEFDVNRPLYDWFLDNLGIAPRPYQYEFARLNIDYTVMSKRKLLQLVQEGQVSGWDDPRMPTIAGLRRRGITPEAIRTFCENIGVTKVDSQVDIGIFEHAIRDDLNYRAPRVMAVLDPLEVTITNFPDDATEWIDADYWPRDIDKDETRPVPFSKTILIERDDFAEEPPQGYKRLAPGRAVRLRHGYVIRCDEVVKDADGTVTGLRCSYLPETLGTNPEDTKVWGVLHWVSADESLPFEARLYDRLFDVPNPDGGERSFKEHLNPESLVVRPDARIEPSVADADADQRLQFERQGYFWQDPEDSSPNALVFNQIITLRDTWAKKRQTAATAPPPEERPQAPAPPPGDPLDALSEADKERLYEIMTQYGIQQDEALVLVKELSTLKLFEDTLTASSDAEAHAQGIANWIVHEVRPALDDRDLDSLPFGGEHLAELVARQDDGTLSSRIAKKVFAEMLETGDRPQAIIEREGLTQISDASALAPVVDEVMDRFPEKVAQYRDGKTGLLGFFMGQVMRATRGQADPELAKNLLREALED
jgi:glutaminyl-tRNA synthetase